MTTSKRLHALGFSVLSTAALLLTLFATLHSQAVATAASSSIDPAAVFQHLRQEKRLHQLHPSGQLSAPDGDWNSGGDVVNGPYTTTNTSLALRLQQVALLRTTAQDEEGQDIGWELSDIERIFNDIWDSHLPYTVLTETQLASQLSGVDILVVPSFKAGYQQDVLANFSAEALTALHDFVAAGGSIYAQGNGAMILEAAEILPAGTVHPTTTLSLPPSAGDVGQLLLDDPTSPLFFNWLTPSLYLLQDPLLTVTGNLQTVASYSDTIGGPQPAIVQGTLGQGRILLVNGHPTAVNQEGQHILLFNALLQSMAEKGELFGRAYQVYTDTVPSNVIPAYEAVTVTANLTFANWWETAVLSDVTVTERVQPGFTILITTITPAPASVLVTVTDGLTETIITWDLGDVFTAPITLTYVAMTDIDALASGEVVFSRGAATYTDGHRQVTWQHPDFILFSAIAADLKGDHDNEPDRFYTIPAEGVYLDEHIWLENIENTPAHNVCIVRYVPLITPIVGLEDQRQPLATNAGETVWMRNSVYGYKNYQLPTGMAHYTETWGIDTHWDGSTVITMTTPGGYHMDPIAPLRDNSGFFVTIPPTYSHAITVTADYELLLPAIRLDWCIGDMPAFWFELPAVRYGIHSQELFSRPVSFTGDPLVDTVVVDATGGSVYTGAGADHLMYRQFLPDAAMIVYTPPAPADAGLVYKDIWGRVHTAELRGNFYDVFNYASCACGDGMGERNAALNVTYGIHIDLDGDGTKETLLTDLEGLKGIMHTRLVGGLDIFIKSINYGNTVAINENVLEAGIFRGLGFTIRPREGTWEESYTATYSTIISNTRRGAYDFLVFEQAIPPQATNLITIHATLDPTANRTEGLLQLHQGARLVYRQNYAGEGQYEVYDSRTQVVQGLRTDVTLDSRAYPSKISTYSDTVYMVHSLNDAHAWQPFSQDPYFTSYGYSDAVASVYVGGRDKRELLYSIIELGERTWIRVELNNNTGTVWDNIQIGVDVPTGMTVTQLFGEQVPIDLWPDIPFLNATRIADASFGLYFFEIQTSETVTDLQGILHQLPITFSADGAPANFTIPPAVLAIKAADGSVPYVITGETIALAVQDGLRGYVTAEDIRLLTQAELNTLRGTINADTAVIPNTENALTYFQSISSTIPFTTVDGVLQPDLAGLKLPWFASGTPSPLHVVIQSSVEVSRSTRYPLNSGAAVTHTDGFGVDWPLNGRTLHVNAVGASLVTTYDWLSIVDLSTGDVVTGVVPNAWNAVTMSLQVENKGTDIATDITQVVDLVGQIELINAPSNITTTAEGLLWQVGDLGPGTTKTVEISFRIFVPNNPLTDQYLLLAGGQLRVIARTDADFINLYAGKRIVAQTGQDFYLPVAHYARASVVYLPLVHQLYSPPLPDLVVSQFSLVGGNLTLVVQNVGSAAVQTPFWIDVYLNPTTPPQAANQTWEAMGAEGLVWAVDGVTLQPNQSLTLTIGDGYFQADRSHYPSLGTAGLPIYVHVDSYNPGVSHGTVLETHERSGGVYNNISAAESQ